MGTTIRTLKRVQMAEFPAVRWQQIFHGDAQSTRMRSVHVDTRHHPRRPPVRCSSVLCVPRRIAQLRVACRVWEGDRLFRSQLRR